tara:strand:- start:23026 stop:23763 length:738 start_codon:yes stop_codon:yes gene_type:complete
MLEASKYRDERGLSFEVWTGDKELIRLQSAVQSVTCPGEHRKDSGTTMISQALTEGHTVSVCGCDLGGRDIYTVRLHLHNKQSWVRRWRNMRRGFPSFDSAIRFIGYDHMPYIQAEDNEYGYYDRYRAELPHIPDQEYIAIFWLLYGKHYVYKRELNPMVKVRYIIGPRIGWETEYRRSIAEIFVSRGLVEVIAAAPADDDITADMTVTKRMNKDTLLKIAGLRAVPVHEDMTKAQLIERLSEEQ